jgi:6-phosphogluconolactonase
LPTNQKATIISAMKFLLAIFLSLAAVASAKQERFYLGTYTKGLSKGIYTGTLETTTGIISPLLLAATTKDPSFLALSPDRNFLYCTTANKSGGVVGTVEAFSVQADGQLTMLNELPCGSDCAHISVDATGRDVFAPSYAEANLMAFQTKPDGSLDRRTAFFHITGSGPNHDRQSQSHPHSMYPDPENRHVYACDLGTDNILIYDLDAATGALTPANPPSAQISPGGGPRHLAFSPDGRFVYVNGEMGLNVTVFERHPATGALTPIQTVSTMPPGADSSGVTTAEIFCHPSGKWLYVSNRGRGSIAVYAIGSDGRLTWVQDAPAEVKVPRGMGIDPTGQWLIAGDQTGNKISVLKVDQMTGKISPTGQIVTVGAPVCVIFD